MSLHKGNIQVTWRGGFNGIGMVQNAEFETPVSLPKEFSGAGKGASPEDLFLSAAASCYLITFGIILDKAKVAYQSLTMDAQLLTEVGPPARIQEIILNPHIVSDVDDETIARLLGRIDGFCLISKAIDGSIKKTVNLKRTSINKPTFQTLTGGFL
jgi:putative redox protein